jgi:hypothetical protein
MEKLVKVVSIDEEFEKGRGPDRQPRKRRGGGGTKEALVKQGETFWSESMKYNKLARNSESKTDKKKWRAMENKAAKEALNVGKKLRKLTGDPGW